MSQMHTLTPAGLRCASAVLALNRELHPANLAHTRMEVHRLAAATTTDGLPAVGAALHQAAGNRDLDADGLRIAIGEIALGLIEPAA